MKLNDCDCESFHSWRQHCSAFSKRSLFQTVVLTHHEMSYHRPGCANKGLALTWIKSRLIF